MSTASIPQANNFLREFKEIITTGSRLVIIPRPPNNTTIIMLGLTQRTIELEILGLSVLDYCSGPSQDRDLPGKVWIFGKEINGHEIYIKLKIAQVNDTKIAKCISFHEAEFSLKYPFKNKT